MVALVGQDDPIVIIGAGVFGLSTALHLAKRGFKNVTIIDKQPYDDTKYSYFNGCDAASAGKLTWKISRCEHWMLIVYAY